MFSLFASVIFTGSNPCISVGAGVVVPAYDIFTRGIGCSVTPSVKCKFTGSPYFTDSLEDSCDSIGAYSIGPNNVLLAK